MNMFQMMQIMQNPQAFLQRMGIPKEHMGSPQSVAQYLLDSGKVTEQQIQQARSFFNGNAQS